MSYTIASDIHLHTWSAFAKTNVQSMNSRLMAVASQLRDAAHEASRGDRLYLAGDLVHVRGSVSTEVANIMSHLFAYIVKELGVEVRAIPGNHDLATRSPTWSSSILSTLEGLGVTCVNEPTYFEDDNVLMVPWVEGTAALRKVLIELSDQYPGADVVMHGHLNGVIKGIPDTGLEPSEIGHVGFKRIFSGHLHDHVDFGNGVYSIGALTHQTWNDVNTRAGFLRVTPDAVEHLASTAPKFVEYDPNDLQSMVGNYVRARVELNTPAEAAAYREYLIEQGALDAVVHPLIKTTQTRTEATVSAGSSIQQSIHDWIGKREFEHPQELERLCDEILEEVE